MAESDTPALGVGRYGWNAHLMALVCQDCGALVHSSTYAAPLAPTVGVHDAFHDFLDSLRDDLRRRDDWAAEDRERADG